MHPFLFDGAKSLVLSAKRVRAKVCCFRFFRSFTSRKETDQISVKHPFRTYLRRSQFNWSDIAITDWRNWVGCVPQPIKIFNGTLLDNICLGNSMEEGEAVVQFCQAFGFQDYFMKLPQNYLTLVGEEGINLSGGQQQLVGLARALFRRPQLLLVDEATSALDRQTEQFVLNLFARIKQQTAIVMVTHRSQSVQLADRVYVMENGVLQVTSDASTVAGLGFLPHNQSTNDTANPIVVCLWL